MSAATTKTTTTKGQDFLADPIKTKSELEDLPAIGPASAKVLKGKGIKNTKQLLGHFLKFDDGDKFIEDLKAMGVKFTKSGNLEDPEGELVNTLQEKWEILQEL